MLSSGQAPREVVAAALSSEYGGPLLQLAAAQMGEAGAAGAAAANALAGSLLNDYRFSSQASVEAWFWLQVVPALRQERPARRKSPLAGLLPGEPADQKPADQVLLSLLYNLQPDLRLTVLLQALLGWPAGRIAEALDCTPERAGQILKSAWASLAAEEFASLSRPDLKSGDLPARLASALAQRYPLDSFSQDKLERLAAAAVTKANRGLTRRSRRFASFEFVLIGLAILAAVGVFWGWNKLSPEPTATPTPAPPTATPLPRLYNYFPSEGETLPTIAARLGLPVEGIARQNYLTPGASLTPGEALAIPYKPLSSGARPTPVKTDAGNPNPLNARSSPDELRQTLARSSELWKTLWADISLIYYGPAGYVGPPTVNRIQVSARSPDDWRVLIANGPASRPLTQLNLGEVTFLADENGYSGINPLNQRYWGYSQLFWAILPANAAEYARSGEIKALSEEFFAGRRVVVAEWQKEVENPAIARMVGFQGKRQLWIDAYTGVLLKQRFFSQAEPDTVLYDLVFQKVFFDVDFPQASLFDPYYLQAGSFSSDYRGTPEPPGQSWATPAWQSEPGRQPRQPQSPPPGFDPRRSRLTFQFQGENPSEGSSPVDLYADDYFLGRISLPALWNMPCDRTPDGRLLYILYSDRTPFSRLHVLDLADISQDMTVAAITNVSTALVSPDGKQAAVIAALKPGGESVLALLDLETYQVKTLRPLEWAQGMVWSPDGKYLAFIRPPEQGDRLEAVALDVANNRAVYRVEVDQEDLYNSQELAPDWPAADFPTHAWAVPFPGPSNNLEDCVFPPK